jgi:hypothetical protein
MNSNNPGITIAFHVDFGYSLFCRFTPKQHEERTLCTPPGGKSDVIFCNKIKQGNHHLKTPCGRESDRFIHHA